MSKFKKFIAFILAASLVCIPAFAEGNGMPIGRYLSVGNKSLPEQRDLLAQMIQVRFPQSVQTIGDAVNYILRYSGYSLVGDGERSSALKNTLQKPLPAVDRNFGPMTLKDGLVTLIGQAFTLQQDSVNREVNFHVKSGLVKKSLTELQ